MTEYLSPNRALPAANFSWLFDQFRSRFGFTSNTISPSVKSGKYEPSTRGTLNSDVSAERGIVPRSFSNVRMKASSRRLLKFNPLYLPLIPRPDPSGDGFPYMGLALPKALFEHPSLNARCSSVLIIPKALFPCIGLFWPRRRNGSRAWLAFTAHGIHGRSDFIALSSAAWHLYSRAPPQVGQFLINISSPVKSAIMLFSTKEPS
jgi:hypothetical protein